MNSFSYQQQSVDELEKKQGTRNSPQLFSGSSTLDQSDVSIDGHNLNVSSFHHDEEHPPQGKLSFQSTNERPDAISFVSPSNQSFSEIKTKKPYPIASNGKDSLAATICLKLSIIIFSFFIAAYFFFEIMALLAVDKKKPIHEEQNPIVALLMQGFSSSDMLLFRNAELSILVALSGLIMITYSVLVLFIGRDRYFPGLDMTHRKIVKMAHIFFFVLFVFGALVQSFLFLMSLASKAAKEVVMIYTSLVLRGGVFYIYMAWYKYVMSRKKPPSEGQARKNMKANAEAEYDQNWEEFYEDMEMDDVMEEEHVEGNYDNSVDNVGHQRDASMSMQIELGEQVLSPASRARLEKHEINVRGI